MRKTQPDIQVLGDVPPEVSEFIRKGLRRNEGIEYVDNLWSRPTLFICMDGRSDRNPDNPGVDGMRKPVIFQTAGGFFGVLSKLIVLLEQFKCANNENIRKVYKLLTDYVGGGDYRSIHSDDTSYSTHGHHCVFGGCGYLFNSLGDEEYAKEYGIGEDAYICLRAILDDIWKPTVVLHGHHDEKMLIIVKGFKSYQYFLGSDPHDGHQAFVLHEG